MEETSPCCAPSSERQSSEGGSAPARTTTNTSDQATSDQLASLVLLPGGEFLMGTDDPVAYAADGERPARRVTVAPFRIDAFAVTNARFAAFVDATGHVTEAERYGWSFVFAGLLPDDFPDTRGVAAAPWWRQVEGAGWRHPEGPRSEIDGRGDHPVVHVSHNDALAYCAWAGARLPSEAEWEYASRGGLEAKRYPWGDELTPGGLHHCNVWQGSFPSRNTLDDGHYGTAPVDAYAPNGYGLYNTSGNAWEWCADWFTRDARAAAAGGAAGGTHRAIRGGSYLCHESYCFRYRVSARSGNTPDSSTGNTGFRIARDA